MKLALIIALGLLAGCAKHIAVVSTSHSFMTEAFFVLEFEHDVYVTAVSGGVEGPPSAEVSYVVASAQQMPLQVLGVGVAPQ